MSSFVPIYFLKHLLFRKCSEINNILEQYLRLCFGEGQKIEIFGIFYKKCQKIKSFEFMTSVSRQFTLSKKCQL